MQQDYIEGFLVANPAYFKHLSGRARQIIRQLEKERYEEKLHQGKIKCEYK